MKKYIIACCLAAVALLAGAQTPAPASRSDLVDAERARINAERSRLEAGFLVEDAACYKRFAVNSCLGDVNVRRRQAMTDLRRQEIMLNDEERQNRGAEQIRKSAAKSSPEKQQAAADARAKALEEYQSRIEAARIKREERAALESREKANSQAQADRLKENQKKVQTRADKQAAATEQAKKFNERQLRAQTRRAQHEADQLKRRKPAANSLPVPE